MSTITFSGRGILLDIEGTTSSIEYVHQVLFPYARAEMRAFLRANWNAPAVVEACEQIAKEAGAASLQQYTANAPAPEAQDKLAAEALRLMDRDAKVTGLKALQGMIWEHGFVSGVLRAHVYDDTPLALAAWNAAGRDVRVYSSGSIAAQKLFFGHTDHGDVLKFFRGYYDTTTGPKKSAASYSAIAVDMKLPPGEILFTSDVVAELNAAREAGMATAMSVRPGNNPEDCNGHPVIRSFAEIKLE